MKLKALALVLLLPACAAAAEDCAKNSDACTAPKKTLSPFLAAAAEPAPAAPAAPAPRAKKAAAPKASVPADPAAVEVSSAAPAAAKPANGASSPAWLVVVAAGLGGLYFYLSGGRRRGRRK